MRSSNKTRSRSKNNNRNRSVGNIVNRVFDSAGPEGKVRGTPQQIIEKYQMLARDAQLGGDRVAAENFQQHSEHYTRMLGEAMREQAEQRQAAEAAQRSHQQGQDENRTSDQQQRNDQNNSGPSTHEKAQQPDTGQTAANGGVNGALAVADVATMPQPVVSDVAAVSQPPASTDDDGLAMIDLGSANSVAEPLVTTPEDAPKPRTRAPRPRKPRTTAKAKPSDPPEASEESVPVK